MIQLTIRKIDFPIYDSNLDSITMIYTIYSPHFFLYSHINLLNRTVRPIKFIKEILYGNIV